MTGTKVNLGIIGTGSAVRRLHLPVVLKMRSEFRVAAVANRTRAKAEELAGEIDGVKVYENYADLLHDANVDAVLIAVPIELNARILTDAIVASKHVLAEKPIAAALPEARAVLRACSTTTKVVAIAENYRYREDVAMAREVIGRGEIGKVSCFSITTKYDAGNEFRRRWFENGMWRQNPAFAGGMITDSGIHTISSLHDVFGSVQQVFAQILHTSPLTEGPDGVLAQFTMSSGAVGHFLACYMAKVSEESVFELAVFGTNGSLRLTEGEVMWLSVPEMKVCCFRPENYDRGYTNQWRNFHRAICGKESLVSTPSKAYEDLLTLEAMLSSGTSGNKVVLDQSAWTTVD